MNATPFLLASLIAIIPIARAGNPPIPVPADISVSLTAVPNINLVPGEPIVFTLSATNLGPEPVDRLLLISSDFYDQFGPSSAPNDCPGLGIVAYDGATFHYNFWWYPTDAGILAIGETRVCNLTLTLTSQAPQTTPFSFGLAFFYQDINPDNNSATVYLRRAIAPIPALSMATALLLMALLAFSATLAARRRTPRHHSRLA